MEPAKERRNSWWFQKDHELGTTFQKPKKDIYKEKSGLQSDITRRSITRHKEESISFCIEQAWKQTKKTNLFGSSLCWDHLTATLRTFNMPHFTDHPNWASAALWAELRLSLQFFNQTENRVIAVVFIKCSNLSERFLLPVDCNLYPKQMPCKF